MRVKKVQIDDVRALASAVAANPDAHFVAPGNSDKVVTSTEAATGAHRLYGGSATGIGIKLKEWNYPVVVNPEKGEISFDNFGGSWGEEDHLDGLVQGYCVEKTKVEAMMQNLSMANEEVEADGTVELTFQVYEAY
jgi:hypothetical protein